MLEQHALKTIIIIIVVVVPFTFAHTTVAAHHEFV